MKLDKPVQKKGVQARELGDEWLLYDPGTGSVHIVNPVAEFVWSRCDGRHSLADIEKEVRSAFSVPERTDVSGHLKNVLQSFKEIGIMV